MSNIFNFLSSKSASSSSLSMYEDSFPSVDSRLEVKKEQGAPSSVGGYKGKEFSLALEAARNESHDRLAQKKKSLTKKVSFTNRLIGGFLTAAAAPVKLAGACAMTAVGCTVGYALSHTNLGVNKEAVDAHSKLRKAFSSKESIENSIVSKRVPTPQGTKSINDIMEDYRLQLDGGKRVTSEEMKTYIALGERIVEAIKVSGSRSVVSVVAADGSCHTIDANLEAVRAISWYLQAKAVVDNAAADRPIATLVSGAMVVVDPDNKLYNFLSSSNSSYGRCSSHFQERSASNSSEDTYSDPIKTLWEGGWASALGYMVNGQPVQRGIEDYNNRLPSAGGTLLFDKLREGKKTGRGELFLKWEHVGTPRSAMSLARYADHTEGWGHEIWNRGKAFSRTIQHAINFASEGEVGEIYRGEKITKGKAKEIYERFQVVVDSLNVSEERKKTALKIAAKEGTSRMLKELNKLSGAAANAEILSLRNDIEKYMYQMGADFGIERKGGEVHTVL